MSCVNMKLAVHILIEASIKLECNIAVRTRALLLYHHFMRCSSNRSALEHNEIMVAAAALKCAARYEEENIDYNLIALVFFSIVNETNEVLCPESREYTAIMKTLITVDYIMQRKLEYTFSHRLTHQFLVPFLSFILERNYKLAPLHKQVSLTSMRFANDAYVDPLCINFKPDHIAIACIHASLHVHGLLKEMEFLEPWFQAFSRDLSITKLREIKVFLFRLYNGEKSFCGEEDQDEECEVIDEDGEKENEDVQVMHVEEGDKEQGEGNQEQGEGNQERGEGNQEHGEANREHGEANREQEEGNQEQEEGNQEQGKGKRRYREGKRKPETESERKSVGVSKRKQGEQGKTKHKKQSKRRHREGNKKRRKGEKDTLEVEGKNKLEDGNEGALEKEKHEEKDKRKAEEESKKKLDNEKELAGGNKREERGEKGYDIENETEESNKKKPRQSSEKEPEEASEKEQNPDASSVDDSSTIDMQLSVWTARFRAAQHFD